MSDPVPKIPWQLLTGEYPPRPGGISDHSAQVAEGLARAGFPVHIWTNDAGEPPPLDGVIVHRLANPWSGAGLRRLSRMLDEFRAPRRLLVQYTPNAWGYKGLNVGFARWLGSRKDRGDEIRLLIHEPWYRPEPWDRPWRYVLPPVQRLMLSSILKVSSHVYVTIPYWERMLRPLAPSAKFVWLPVPSNVPFVDDPEGVTAIRRKIADAGTLVVGTFGTYREEIAPRLRAVLPPLFSKPGRVGLLIGRNGPAFALTLGCDPAKVVATGGLSPREVALHLQACDVLIQPYRDGVTSRRGTVMAGLCQGIAVVTTSGKMTESVWAERSCVALAPEDDPASLVEKAEVLLADPEARRNLGSLGKRVYVQEFALERTMEILLKD